jgi:hypothetical protein
MDTAAPPQPSFLLWLFQSLGLMYSGLFLLSAVIGFVLTLVLLVRGKGPMSVVCLLLVVHLPVVIGVLGAVQGMISMYSVLAASNSTPKPADLAQGISISLVTVLIGSMLTLGFYLLAIPGTLLRSFRSESPAA